jgi:hypothetical protein
VFYRGNVITPELILQFNAAVVRTFDIHSLWLLESINVFSNCSVECYIDLAPVTNGKPCHSGFVLS